MMSKAVFSLLIFLLFPPTAEAPATDGLHFVAFPERSMASCLVYELQNENNQKVSLSRELEELLECPSELPVIAPDESFLIYIDGHWTAVKTYHLQTHETQTLMTFDEQELGGISFMGWSPDESRLAVVTVDWNYEQGPTLTKLHLLTFSPDGTFTGSTSHDIKITMSCSSANCTPAPEDFTWLDDETISYRTWNEAPYDLEEPDAFRTLNLPNT